MAGVVLVVDCYLQAALIPHPVLPLCQLTQHVQTGHELVHLARVEELVVERDVEPVVDLQ